MCVRVVTRSSRVKLLRQQLIAAAHAADSSQLCFSHKHPERAGSQVSTRVQADHDGILVVGGGGEERMRARVEIDGGID